jgi:hypothetical protein
MEGDPTRYDVRRDGTGWTVFDRWTNEVVVVSFAKQCGLAWDEATELVNLLNRKDNDGDRRVLQ